MNAVRLTNSIVSFLLHLLVLGVVSSAVAGGVLPGLVALPLLALLYFSIREMLLPEGGTASFRRARPYIVLISLGVLAAASSLLILTPKILNWDEGYYLNAAVGFSLNGTLTLPMWRVPEPTSLIIGGGQGYGAVLYLSFLDAAGATLVNARLFSFFFLLASIALVYLLTRKVFGPRSAFLSTAIYITSFPFIGFLSSRIDSFAVCGYLCLLLAYVHTKDKRSRTIHFLFGAFSLAAAEIHLYGLIYVFTVGAVYLLDAFSGRGSWKRLISFGAGAALTGSLYLYSHFIRFAEAKWQIMEGCAHCIGSPLLREYIRFKDLILNHPLESLFLALIFSWGIKEKIWKDAAIREWLLLAGFGYLGFALGVPPHYEQHLLPLLLPLLGELMRRIFSVRAKLAPLAAFTLLMMFLQNGAQIYSAIDQKSPGLINPQYAECISAVVPRTEVVAAPGPFFAYLTEYVHFLNAGTNPFLFTPSRDLSEEAFLEEESPAAILTLRFGVDTGQDRFRTFARSDEQAYEEFVPELFFLNRYQPEDAAACQALSAAVEES